MTLTECQFNIYYFKVTKIIDCENNLCIYWNNDSFIL